MKNPFIFFSNSSHQKMCQPNETEKKIQFPTTYFYTVVRQSWHVIDGQMPNPTAAVCNVPEALD